MARISPDLSPRVPDMAHRILLVEDDGLTADIVAGLLSARGYDVDVVSDGVSAIAALCKGGYDLALIDYHLPEVDGYSSARVVGSMAPIVARPKLVALTADPESLNARDGATTVFDTVMSKPFEPAELFERIEGLLRNPELEATTEDALASWRRQGLQRRPRAFTAPASTPVQALALAPYFEIVASPASADVLLLLDADRLGELSTLRRQGVAHLLPSVDLTGARTRELDISFSPAVPASWAAVAKAVRDFPRRAARLAPSARFSSDPGVRLMAQLFVSDRCLEPVPDPRDRRLFNYAGAAGDAAPAIAEDLADRGLLAKNFAERFHVCGACESHRMNVREECPSCRSSDIGAVKMLRHLRCGGVAAEDDCRRDGRFSCSACARDLGRYGTDYVRAGERLRCRSCGAAHEFASVGFVCLDCDAHSDGEAVGTRDVHAYVLTSRAIALLTEPAKPRAPAEAVERAAAARRQGRPSILAELRFASAEMMIATEGDVAFEALRRRFVEMVVAAFGDDAHAVEGARSDFLVVTGRAPEVFCEQRDALLRACEERLAKRLGARLSILEAA